MTTQAYKVEEISTERPNAAILAWFSFSLSAVPLFHRHNPYITSNRRRTVNKLASAAVTCKRFRFLARPR